MNLRYKNVYRLLIIIAYLGLHGCESENFPIEDFIGADQSLIIKYLGEPDEIEEIVRSKEHVFGPIEDLWYKVEIGEKIVIWKYETHDGWKELYFLNDSTEVVGEFRWYDDLEVNHVL